MKRILDELIPKAAAWSTANVQERQERLVTGAELEWFGALSRERNECDRNEPDDAANDREQPAHRFNC